MPTGGLFVWGLRGCGRFANFAVVNPDHIRNIMSMKRPTYFSMIIAAVGLLLTAASCSKQKTDQAASSESPEAVAASSAAPQELPLPEVPALITAPEARADYVAARFWAALDFNDTSLSLDTAFMEQNFANFTSVLPVATERGRRTAMDSLVARATVNADALAYLAEVAEKYLYDPNSPLRDDDSYIAIAEALGASTAVSEWVKARPKQLAERLRKNRPGTRAADFDFTTPDGRRMKLATFADKSEGSEGSAVILVFFDPECPTCDETLHRLAGSDRLADAIAAGALRVIAVYPPEEDSISEHWADYAAKLPATWTTGIVAGPETFGNRYALPALPSIYLLDGNLTVMGRDLTLASPQLQSIL